MVQQQDIEATVVDEKCKELQIIDKDVEQEQTKPLKYPRSVAFIISNEFCERFNYYGMRTILVLYLTQKLGYSEEDSTVLFHIFTMLVYIFPLFGALAADGWLGKYKTILYLSCLYSIGALVVSFGAIPLRNMPTKLVTLIGLLFIAIGTGGIKPCVSAFGGDQFVLPEQGKELAKFFSLFYFAINAGSMLSTTVTPLLRADVHCFDDEDCFSLAFGVPAVLMILSVLIFVAGRKKYTRNPPTGNMLFGVAQCYIDAFKGWRNNRHDHPQPYFLDYATPTMGSRLVRETKSLSKVLTLYLPFPIFWALFDQQGSRWTFQATRMDGNVGGYLVKPDQMQVANPLLILTFIPLFDYVVYPLLKRVHIRRPLQKLTIGGLLAALAFIFSAIVEMHLEMAEPRSAPDSSDIAHFRLYNGMPCRYEFTSDVGIPPDAMTIPRYIEPLEMWSELSLHVSEPTKHHFQATPRGENTHGCTAIEGFISLEPGRSVGYYLAHNELHEFEDGLKKTQNVNSMPLVRALVNTPAGEGPIHLRSLNSTDMVGVLLDKNNAKDVHELPLGIGYLDINGRTAAEFETRYGGLYTLMVEGSVARGYNYSLIEVVSPTSVSIIWQLPQIVAMTAAEIMFSVTGLEFSFTQAPPSMKSVLQACWLLSVAIGNMIVVIIAEVKFVDSQSAEFMLFASIMLVDMLLFAYLTRNYQYSTVTLTDSPQKEKKQVERQKEKEPVQSRPAARRPKRPQGGGCGYRNRGFDTDI